MKPLPPSLLTVLFFQNIAQASAGLLRHEALDAGKKHLRETRGRYPPGYIPPPPPTYTYITPSPDATPIPVTSQSQTITSFIPLYTICYPPAAPTATPSPVPPRYPYPNGTNINTTTTTTTTVPTIGGFPNLYWPAILPPLESCITAYNSTILTVCHSTLYGLATAYTITACSQPITFSSHHGYRLVPAQTPASASTADIPGNLTIPPPPPSLVTYTTFYIAPWQVFTATATAGGAIPSDVQVKICHSTNDKIKNGMNGTKKEDEDDDNDNDNDNVEHEAQRDKSMECVTSREAWRVVPHSLQTTATSTLSFEAAVTRAPATVMVETVEILVAQTETTFAFSSVREVVVAVETERVVREPVVSTSTSSAGGGTPTVTRTAWYVGEEEPSASTGDEPTTTITLTSTRTTYVGTQRRTLEGLLLGETASADPTAPA